MAIDEKIRPKKQKRVTKMATIHTSSSTRAMVGCYPNETMTSYSNTQLQCINSGAMEIFNDLEKNPNQTNEIHVFSARSVGSRLET
jgi:hypothetical protein